jgi:hypothetical protein
MRLGYVVRIREVRSSYTILVQNLKLRESLGDIDVDGYRRNTL